MDDLLASFLAVTLLMLLAFSKQLILYWRYLRMTMKLPIAKDYTPIIGHLLEFAGPRKYLQEKCDSFVLKNNTRAPFVAWMGPIPLLYLFRPEHVEVILGSSKYIDKPLQYTFLEPWLGTGLLTSSGKKWHTHRKIITPTFHFKILDNFLSVFSEKSKILVKKLEKELKSEKFNIFPYIGLCALDVICETAMGVEINAQNQERQSEYVNAVTKVTDDLMDRMMQPWLYPDFAFKFTSKGRRMANCLKVLHGMTNKVIKERKVVFQNRNRSATLEDDIVLGRKKRMTFLDLLLENSENGINLTDEEIREEVDTFMFEGHDTTTAAIGWALQLLASHPEIQQKAYEEVKSFFIQDSDHNLTMQDMSDMKYLEMVIKETLRLYPSVPLTGREIKEDVVIDGYTIPAGMKVAVIPYHTHRVEEHFPHPEIFDPDRFLPENVSKRHPYAYIPFSAGPRNCIGQKFAMLEMKSTLSHILYNYKLQATGKVPPALPELILRPAVGVYLKITKRVH